jgi:hypothetical protein
MIEQTNEQVKVFNPREHLIQLKSREGSKDYLPVQWRLVWFREMCPNGTIETEIVHLDLEKETEEEVFVWNSEKRRSEKSVKTARGVAVVRAVARDGKGGIATGTKMEKAAAFGDYLEKAETGAIGRALAALGYGTQFAPDLDEAQRIVDAPVDRTPTPNNNVTANNGNNNKSESDEGTITEQQVNSIRKLCLHLKKSEPDNITSISYLAAKRLIQTLTAEYREAHPQGNNKAS